MNKLTVIRDLKQTSYYPFVIMPTRNGKPLLERGVDVKNVDHLASAQHRLDRALQGVGLRLAEFEWLPELTVVTASVGEIAEAVFHHVKNAGGFSGDLGWPDEELLANVNESDEDIRFEGYSGSAHISKSRLVETMRQRLAFRP